MTWLKEHFYSLVRLYYTDFMSCSLKLNLIWQDHKPQPIFL